MAVHEVSTPETEMHDVQLLKTDLGLGITVAGYVCDEENISGIFVKEICSGSAADLTGKIQINDRIVKVNGKSITTLSNYQAIELLRNSGPTVMIRLERYLRGPRYERLQQNISSDELPSPDTPNYIPYLENSNQEERFRLDVLLRNGEENKQLFKVDSPIKEEAVNSNASCDQDGNTNGFELNSNVIASNVLKSTLSDNPSNKNMEVNLSETISTKRNELCQLRLNSGYSAEKDVNHFFHITMVEEEPETPAPPIARSDNSVNSDSSCLYFSKASDDTEKDEYDTCIDESLSEDISAKLQKQTASNDIVSEVMEAMNSPTSNIRTPETIIPDTDGQFFHPAFLNSTVSAASSEPCLNLKDERFPPTNEVLGWSAKIEDNLKPYINPANLDETDEFFLVQCLEEDIICENKCLSESNVPDSYVVPTGVTYKRLKLHEYYNDYKDCLEDYNIFLKDQSRNGSDTLNQFDSENYSYTENTNVSVDDEEVVPQILPFKSNSEPHILGSFCEAEEYNFKNTRRYSVRSDCGDTFKRTMTVTSKQQSFSLESNEESKRLFEKHWGSVKNVQVYRKLDENLGISIVCGKVDLHTSDATLGTTSGIFVKSVVANSAAGRTEQFHTGDRILEVDGVDLTGAGHEEAVAVIRNASNPISFVVQSLVPLPLNDLCEHSNVSPHHTPPKTSDYADNCSKINDETELNLKQTNTSLAAKVENDTKEEETNNEETYEEEKVENQIDDEEKAEVQDSEDTEKEIPGTDEQEIDRSSPGSSKKLQEDDDDGEDDSEEEDEFGYTADKIKKKYAKLGNTIMMVQLERGQQGLGLSLAGHKDRNCMAVFVCGLNPNGAAYKVGSVQVGDEILEVNGVVLHGRCHLNASAIIKGLAGPIFKILILRRKTAIHDIAVRPVTQFPVSLEEEISEDKLKLYPNVRSVAIQKGSHSLGIMIIEGKHAELGQGIFISDIQMGSSAEKAGLEVGEMILAVNTDSLLGSDYSTAANLLKRTEGVVTLILSNPTKKSASALPEKLEAENQKSSATLKVSAPPSRATTPIPEPPADPLSCSILAGKNTTIELVTDNQGLGLYFVGGKDTAVAGGIVIVEVYSGGAAAKDGRLLPGDQIMDASGVCLKEATSMIALQTLRQTLPKMKLVIFRPEKIEYNTIDVDLVRKPAKGLGISVIAKKSGKGVYVSEILNGGVADVDGRIAKGDLLVSISGQDVESLSVDEVGAIIKTISGKTTLKIHRYKPIIR